MRQSVVGLRYNVSQPHYYQPSQAQTAAIPMAHIKLIQQLGNAHMLLMGDQHWNIVYSFTLYGQLVAHIDELTTISDSRPEMSER